MKFIILFLVLIVISVTIIINKNSNQSYLKKNGIKTTGTITKIFSRGKLPFCKFSYTNNNQVYFKKQEIPKHLINKILNKKYIVYYDLQNPNNAIIQLKKEVK